MGACLSRRAPAVPVRDTAAGFSRRRRRLSRARAGARQLSAPAVRKRCVNLKETVAFALVCFDERAVACERAAGSLRWPARAAMPVAGRYFPPLNPDPVHPPRERIFNVPLIVVMLVAVLGLVHAVLVLLLTAEQTTDALLLFAFIPARYDPSVLADVAWWIGWGAGDLDLRHLRADPRRSQSSVLQCAFGCWLSARRSRAASARCGSSLSAS